MKNLMRKNIIWIALAVVVIVFLAFNMKIIDKGTEGQYTGVVAFDASASSSSDWDSVVAEITQKAVDITSLESLSKDALGLGTAVRIKATVTEYVSKASGKKNTMIIVPEGYTGDVTFTVELGSIYTATNAALRDTQTTKTLSSHFTNQTEWSQYAKALNDQSYANVIAPLGIDETIQEKTVTIIGAATAVGKAVTITPVSIVIE